MRLQLFALPKWFSIVNSFFPVHYDAVGCCVLMHSSWRWKIQCIKWKSRQHRFVTRSKPRAINTLQLQKQKKEGWNQLGRLRYCFGQIGLLGCPMRAQFTDKRFGEAEEASRTPSIEWNQRRRQSVAATVELNWAASKKNCSWMMIMTILSWRHRKTWWHDATLPHEWSTVVL